jgi:hypothetical protein
MPLSYNMIKGGAVIRKNGNIAFLGGKNVSEGVNQSRNKAKSREFLNTHYKKSRLVQYQVRLSFRIGQDSQ